MIFLTQVFLGYFDKQSIFEIIFKVLNSKTKFLSLIIFCSPRREKLNGGPLRDFYY